MLTRDVTALQFVMMLRSSTFVSLGVLFLCLLVTTTAGKSKRKKYVVYVPVKHKVVHHTHTIYVHVKDKDKKGDEWKIHGGNKHEWKKEHDAGHKHAWKNFKSYSEYKSRGSSEHTGGGRSGGYDDGHYGGKNYGNGEYEGKSYGDGGRHWKYGVGAEEGSGGKSYDNGDYGSKSYGDHGREHKIGGASYEGVGEKGNSEGDSAGGKGFGVEWNRENHNHGGGRHEWQSYTDVMDNHGTGGHGTRDWKDNDVKPESWKDGEGTRGWKHSGGGSHEVKHHHHGDEGAWKHSDYDQGHRTWRHGYY